MVNNTVLPVTNNSTVIQCLINNNQIQFELDSGSTISTINHKIAHEVGAVVRPTVHRVLGYSGNAVQLCGETQLLINYNNKCFTHKFLVVKSNSVNLFGRDLFTKFNMHITVPSSHQYSYSTVHIPKYSVLREFKDYISDDYVSNVKQTVKLNVLPNAKPVFSKSRSVPVRMKELVKLELNRLVESGKISKVFSSEWASPTVNVLKSDGSVRICGDFSATVNQFLDPVNSTLPSIDEIIANIGNASVFSKIDLANAFLQLPLEDDSKIFTTINTSEGLFRFNYLPFGLSSSPGTFQAFMTKILNNIDNVIVYQDDLLILSANKEQHNVTLHKVLTAIKNAGIKLNIKKSSFFMKEIEYLGFIFSEGSVKPNSDKIRAVLDSPAPTNLKQLQAFLGMSNFYSRFIPNYSHVLGPLYKLLKKGVPFTWDKPQIDSFNSIKRLFAHNNFLKLFNPSLQTMLETDSSGYGIAAVLYQRENSNSEWYPIQFASRSLNPAEINYSNIEREALSVIFGTEKFKKFLLGSKFIIRNDQQPLRKLFAHNASVPTNCSARLQRWSLRISHFNYVFEYSKGSLNVNSDCLSRLPLPESKHECEPYELIFTCNSIDKMPINCKDIQFHTAQDKDLCQLMHYIKYGWPINQSNSNLSKYKNIINQMSITKGCILYHNRVLIPMSLRKNVLDLFHEGHPGICAMKSAARSLIWYHGIDKDICNLVQQCKKCQSVRSKPPQNRTLEWQIPPRPWSRIHIDHFFYNNYICLVVVDALSKYIECEIVPSTSAKDTIDALRIIFSRNGLCDIIVSDNATSFVAETFQKFISMNGITHVTSPPYMPQSNGQAERSVRVIKDMLKKGNFNNDSFKSQLANVLFQYRATPHSVTQIAPSISLNKRKLVCLKDRVNPQYFHFHDLKNKCKTIPQFEVGDKVLALNLREGPKWYNSTIMQKLSANIYNVLVHDLNIIWKRHSNQILMLTATNENNNDDFDNVNDDSQVEWPLVVNPNLVVPNNDNHTNADITSNNDIETVPLRRSQRSVKPPIRYGFDD